MPIATSENSPRLSLPLLMPAQAQKHVTHNEALLRLDLLVQLTVEDFDATTPPAAPAEGQVWALGAAPTGVWEGKGGQLAAFLDGAWQFITPARGWRAWGAAGAAGGGLRVFDGSGWGAPVSALDNLDGLGIGTAHDASNRLAVAAEATLLSHAGADHRLVVNRAGAGATASLLFQSGWSGRAEMGLAGGEDFAVKVSADGSSWTEALRLDAATGLAGGAAVQQGAADATPGRLMRADWGVLRTALAGTVAMAGGAPAGAVFERGEGADGSYLRLADGSQICTRAGWSTAAAGSSWTFPQPFAAAPAVLAIAADTSAARIATAGGASATAATVRLFTTAGAGVAGSVTSFAFGRWA